VIRIQALGGLAVRADDGRPLAGAVTQPRRMALLAILARSGERGVSRDRVLAMLWPDAEEERARNNLAQALYALRRDLGADDAIAGTKELRLEPARVGTDVAEFCGAITRGQEGRAAELYAGPFLDGFHVPAAPEFERWADQERRTLAHDHARALESLARAATARDDAAEAVTWWRRLAALEPLNARYAIGLMEALTAAGDRASALRHARVYEVLLEQELDLPPDREVVALAERLRLEASIGGQQTAVARSSVVRSAAPPASPHAPAPAEPSSGPALAAPPPSAPSPEPKPIAPPDAAEGSSSLAPPQALPAVPAPPPTSPRRRRVGWRRAPLPPLVGAAALFAVIGAGAVIVRGARRAERLVPGPTRRVAFDAALELDPALSPDGKVIAYAADPDGAMRLYVRQVAGGRALPVSGEIGGYHRAPRWSPDGSQIAFQADGSLYVVPAFGGVPRLLVKAPSPSGWAAYPAWSPDGQAIAYSQNDTLYVRPVAGGEPRVLTAAVPSPHSLAWSPDGRRLAVVSGNSTFVFGSGGRGSAVNVGNGAPSSIWVVPGRGGGAPVRLTDDRSLSTSPAWLPDGRALLFVSDRDGERDVYRLDLTDDGGPAGPVTRLTAGLDPHTISLSADGRRLAYSVFSLSSNLWRMAIPADAPASLSSARALTSGSQVVEGVSVSPDGRWLAFDSDRAGNQDIYKISTDGGDLVQVTADPADDFMPAWSPNGREIAFHEFHGGDRRVAVVSADGGEPALVAAAPSNQRFPGWSPDGMALVFASDATGRTELYVVQRRVDGDWAAARQLTGAGGFNGRWSPDGRHIAYTRDDGVWMIASDAAAGAPARLVLATDSSDRRRIDVVQWSADGRVLYYKAFDDVGRSSIWSVRASECPRAVRGAGCAPRLLVRFDDVRRQSNRPEFATDGRNLYFTITESASDVWTMELTTAPR